MTIQRNRSEATHRCCYKTNDMTFYLPTQLLVSERDNWSGANNNLRCGDYVEILSIHLKAAVKCRNPCCVSWNMQKEEATGRLGVFTCVFGADLYGLLLYCEKLSTSHDSVGHRCTFNNNLKSYTKQFISFSHAVEEFWPIHLTNAASGHCCLCALTNARLS